MGKRTNTAVWLDKYGRWQIKVQKDGQRRTFTSSKPGRTGLPLACAPGPSPVQSPGAQASGRRTARLTPGWMTG